MLNNFLKPKPEPFSQYFPAIEDMNSKQLKFYKYWKKNIMRGKYINLDDNVSYAFVYIYEILSSNDPEKIIEELSIFSEVYKGEDNVSTYCDRWISDSYVYLNKIPEAIESYGQIPINSQASYQTDRLLSLKISLNQDISARDVLTLLGPKVTNFAKNNLEDIKKYISISIKAEKENESKHFLKDWLPFIKGGSTGYSIYNGTVYQRFLKNITQYNFSKSDIVAKFIKELTREAENSFREERGVPKIGEGWIAETNLFYEIKKAFPKNDVIHHARPSWLGRQHLDIFIKDLSVAIEYQGKQHYEPIDFFGGEEAYLQNIKRDKRKKLLCKRNKINLIHVRKGYSLSDLIEEIKEKTKN